MQTNCCALTRGVLYSQGMVWVQISNCSSRGTRSEEMLTDLTMPECSIMWACALTDAILKQQNQQIEINLLQSVKTCSLNEVHLVLCCAMAQLNRCVSYFISVVQPLSSLLNSHWCNFLCLSACVFVCLVVWVAVVHTCMRLLVTLILNNNKNEWMW